MVALIGSPAQAAGSNCVTLLGAGHARTKRVDQNVAGVLTHSTRVTVSPGLR